MDFRITKPALVSQTNMVGMTSGGFPEAVVILGLNIIRFEAETVADLAR